MEVMATPRWSKGRVVFGLEVLTISRFSLPRRPVEDRRHTTSMTERESKNTDSSLISC